MRSVSINKLMLGLFVLIIRSYYSFLVLILGIGSYYGLLTVALNSRLLSVCSDALLAKKRILTMFFHVSPLVNSNYITYNIQLKTAQFSYKLIY